jgi:hypothetical protein
VWERVWLGVTLIWPMYMRHACLYVSMLTWVFRCMLCRTRVYHKKNEKRKPSRLYLRSCHVFACACGIHVCTCLCVREIDMGMDMHTCILYVHTLGTWSVKGARDAEAGTALCVCMCSLCVHVCVFVCVHDRVCIYIYMHMYTYVCFCINVYVYVCSYIYTHT